MQNPPACPSDLTQDNHLWLQLWRDQQQEGFHQLSVTPLLARFWPQLRLSRSHRVLVPLCGKSLDLLWLAQQGHEVVGIELSPVAVEAFFAENQLKVKKQRVGNFIRWHSDQITIWCGDYFSLTPQQIGLIDAVLDRAALTALNPSIRAPYIQQLLSLTQESAPVLLFAIEDIEEDSAQNAIGVDQELAELCHQSYSISLLHSEALLGETVVSESSATPHAKIYQLRRALSK